MTAELFDFPDHEPPCIERLHDRWRVANGLVARLDGYRPLMIDVDVPLQHAPAPVVMWLHGGAWRWGTGKHTLNPLPTRYIRDKLLQAGIAYAAVEYRLSAEATWPAALHDVKAAIRWTRHHASALRIDPDRIGLWGESAGGTLAALAATTGHLQNLEGDIGVRDERSDVSACVNWFGPADLTARPMPDLVAAFVGHDPANAWAASPLFQVTRAAAPMLLVHGEEDSVVPISDSERLTRSYRNAQAHAELVAVPGAGHALAGVDPRPLIHRSIDFLSSMLSA